jgi:hypothetical protein
MFFGGDGGQGKYPILVQIKSSNKLMVYIKSSIFSQETIY